MSQAEHPDTINTIDNQQACNQFGTQRDALLFAPGTYGSAASPLTIPVGYYTSIAGLGQNPNQVTINGTIDAYNQCHGGSQTSCNATTNFWRSIRNLTMNVTGLTGCFNGERRLGRLAGRADAPRAHQRQLHVDGLLRRHTGLGQWRLHRRLPVQRGRVTNGSQQQFMTRDTDIDSWSNAVWNQVFCGNPGAPAQSFAGNSGDTGGPQSYTTLGTCPTTQEEPYLYTDSSGNYNVFVPSVRTNSSGPSWANGNTPGTSLPLSSFYVVNSAAPPTPSTRPLPPVTTC